MIVRTLLSAKSSTVACVRPYVSVQEATRRLAELRIGALVVTDERGTVIGVFSERDLVKGAAEVGGAVVERTVEDLMSRKLLTVGPDDTVDRLMALMTNERIRHLPVLEGGRLIGIVSIGDVVKHKIAQVEGEAEALRAYIAS